jgi:hypothetical protein
MCGPVCIQAALWTRKSTVMALKLLSLRVRRYVGEPMFSAVYIRLAPRISNLSVTMSKPAGLYTRRCVSEPTYKIVDNVDSLGVRMATLEVRCAVNSTGRFPARNCRSVRVWRVPW